MNARGGLSKLFGPQRVAVTLTVTALCTLLVSFGWESGLNSLVIRTVSLGVLAMIAFGLVEQWPRRLPKWVARWALQVFAVAATIPVSAYVIWELSTDPGAPRFWEDRARLEGFGTLAVLGLLVAPWVALAALVRQKDALARYQALQFELERSKFERQATEARMNLLQAQVAPHFLFNTLANIKALVDAGSPQASGVLMSLIAYLRAAVPRLYESTTTLDRELQLVQAYLEIMHMRMPDRLTFELHAAAEVRALYCPPICVLTLVENAVRHGIDPSESGGHIVVRAQRDDGRCRIRVTDTGIGLSAQPGAGTGLANLRERLRVMFGDEAHLRIGAREPHGVEAELDFPASAKQP
ncbi:MAG TPA: histidine kinase [Rudaea sp.]